MAPRGSLQAGRVPAARSRRGLTPRLGILSRASFRLVIFTLAGLWLAAPRAAAQTGRHVLLVVNGASEASVRIGEHYARSRGVPADQIIRLTAPTADEIPRADFTGTIERPIRAWLTRTGAQDRILYIVLTKGVPLRVAGSGGLRGTVASVDSELALLYRRMAGFPVVAQGRIDNPYYLGTRALEDAAPFSHQAHDIYLVSRLDGYTEADVIALIDRGKAPVSRGTFVLDMKAALIERANAWLQSAADRLGALGYPDRVLLDTTARVVTGEQHVLGYYSWGSNDAAQRQRTPGLTFVPGALAAMFVSTDGRTFTPPPDDWKIGTWDNKASYYAGSPQSLAGDLIRAGVTGVAAHVAEPYLDATIRPEILFPAYVSGFNLVEAYYLAMPYLSWQTVVVGDPLCAPFPRREPPAGTLEPTSEPDSELPAFFARRRLASLSGDTPAAKPAALRLLMRGERRLALGDTAGGRQAFEEAVALDPQLTAGHLALATLYEQAGQYDKAIDHYRQVIAIAPNDVPALNNLAYGLAARQDKPAEALPIAERAYTISRGAPLVADTLGWVHHLAGDQAQAMKYIKQAVTGLPKHGEIRWHYATVLAATGERDRASRELATALDLDPALRGRTEVLALQKSLAARP